MNKTFLALKKLSWWLLPPLWMGVIYLFSNQSVLPGSEVFVFDFIIKKTGHLVFYMILFWSWHLAFTANQVNYKSKRLTTYGWLIILLCCFVYAVFDEYHQSLIPGRSARWRDVGIDLLGSHLAFFYSYKLI